MQLAARSHGRVGAAASALARGARCALAAPSLALLALGARRRLRRRRRPPPPPAPPPRRRARAPATSARSTASPRSTPRRSRGRRIALDPGHGGFFRGALGVNGLTEAEVNLGVALDAARPARGARRRGAA